MQSLLSQRGFTLLEILIATVLLAVMMTLLLGAFRVAASTWEKGEHRANQVNRMLIVSNFLRNQISGAIAMQEPPNPMMQNAMTGVTRPMIFYGSSQRLRFMGTIPAQVHGGIYQFELYVSDENGGEGHRDLRAAICPFIRSKDSQPQPACAGQENKIDDVAIVEDVDTVSIRFFKNPDQMNLGQGPQGPLEVWEGHNDMPAFVAIDIAPRGEEPWPTIMVEPRADAQK
jgi:general secretion pathway protein J